MTGISTPSLGPNCRLTAEYRVAIETAILRLQVLIPVMPTRPPDRAPREAPNLLLGSYEMDKNNEVKTWVSRSCWANNK